MSKSLSYQQVIHEVSRYTEIYNPPLNSLTGYPTVDLYRLKSLKPILDEIDRNAQLGSCCLDKYILCRQAELLKDLGFKVEIKWVQEKDVYCAYKISW